MTLPDTGLRIFTVMAKNAKSVIALVGEEQYLKNEELRNTLESLSSEGSAEISEFDGREASVAAVFDELRTFPFLGTHRAVVIRNAQTMFSGDSSAEESLIRYLDNPVDFSTLILDFTALDGRSRLGKALKKLDAQIRFEHMREYQLPQWLAGRAQQRYGKRLNSADAAFMVEMVGANPGLLDSELSKIVSLAPESKAIRHEDVESVITRGRAQTIFKLTEQVEAKNTLEALRLLDDILSQGLYDERAGSVSKESTGIAPYLLHMLNWSLQRLWRAGRLLSEGKSEQEISDELKLHPRFKDRFLANLRRFWPLSECRRCHRELLLTDRQVKVSADRVSSLLETLVVQICTKPKVRGRAGQ